MIELVVPAGVAAELAGVSDELRIIGLWREPLQDDLMLLRILARSNCTELIVKELDSRFGSQHGYRLVIFEVQATVPHPEADAPDATAASTAESAPEQEKPENPRHVACVELVQRLSGNLEANRAFVAAVVLSTIVATIGLMRGNAAVVIGAMVIAPLLGPNMTLALATTLGDSKLAWKAIRVNAVGVVVAFLLAVIIGMCVAVDPTAAELSSRTSVDLSDVVLALAAGSAGALALTTGLSEVLVGVMVAVALLPPLATAGLLLGSGRAALASDALLLTLANVVGINLAGVATFVWQGIQPRHWYEKGNARRMVRLVGGIWLGLLALLAAIILLARR